MANSDDTVCLPIDIVRTVPLGMDCGTSIAKILYRAKQDKAYNSDPQRKTGIMRIKSIPVPDIESDFQEAVVSYLVKHGDMDTSGQQVTANVTGVQSAKLATCLKDKFGITLTYSHEAIDFARCALYFSQMHGKSEDIFFPLPEEGIKEGNALTATWKEIADEFIDGIHTYTPSPPDKLHLPCILVMLGSAYGFLKVAKDGSMTVADGGFKGGRTFVGLANLLTGEKDFDKIIEMSLAGDRRKVDTSLSDIAPPTVDPNNPYAEDFSNFDISLHIFGKAVNRGKDSADIKDVLNSLLCLWVIDIAQVCQLVARNHNIPRAYMCGSFITHPGIRSLITREFVFRNGNYSFGKQEVDFQFVRHGSHMGAIGAYYLNNATQKPEIRQTKKVME